MKRMGIFIFYDKAGIVDEYIEILLSSMQDVLDCLIIIINRSVRNEGYRKLKNMLIKFSFVKILVLTLEVIRVPLQSLL